MKRPRDRCWDSSGACTACMWAEVSSDTCCHAQKWGSWEAGKREPHRLRGKGGCGLGWTWGVHGNLAFLFLINEVPQQLLWVLEPPVRVWGGGEGGTDGTVPGAGGGEVGAGIPHLVSCALFILALLCSLQIMIEFCPGGAVDAIMLGESSSVQGVWGSALSRAGVLHAHPSDSPDL